MEIRNRTDFEVLKGQIAQELLENPQFEAIIESQVFRPLFEGKNISVNIDSTGRFIRVSSEVKINKDDNIPNSVLDVTDIALNESNHIYVTESHGTLFDARAYYQDKPEKLQDVKISSVLRSSYKNTVYNENGIEMSTCYYQNDDWDFVDSFSRVNYDNKDEFKNRLLADGFHKPAEWFVNGPKIPQCHTHASIRGINRTSAVGVAEKISYEHLARNGAINVQRQLYKLDDERLDRLRINDFDKFADYNPNTHQYEVTKFFADNYPDMSVEDLIEVAKNHHIERIETSRLFQDIKDNPNSAQKYEALLEMLGQNQKHL